MTSTTTHKEGTSQNKQNPVATAAATTAAAVSTRGVVDPHLMSKVHARGAMEKEEGDDDYDGGSSEKRFHRVLLRFEPSHLSQIWSQLSARAPIKVVEESNVHALHNVVLADVVDVIISHHDHVKQAFHDSLLREELEMVLSSVADHKDDDASEKEEKRRKKAISAAAGTLSAHPAILQRHIERIGKYAVPETGKLHLVNVIATDLDNRTARHLTKIFHENPDLAKKIGLEYFEISREFRGTSDPLSSSSFSSSSPSPSSEADEPAWQIRVNPDVWKYDSKQGFDGSGVVVAVVDSGADLNHEDLKGKCIAARDFTKKGVGTGSTLAADDVTDSTGHGTHVASTILGSGLASSSSYSPSSSSSASLSSSATAAGSRDNNNKSNDESSNTSIPERKYKGIAYNSKLMVAKVLGLGGTGTTEQIVKGIEWAVNNGADVINLSLGTPTPTDGSDSLSKAVERAVNDFGIVVCVAAGNDGREYDDDTDAPTGKRAKRSIGSPGCTPSAITVGAVDKFNNVADFSSIGPVSVSQNPSDLVNVKPDVVAPGVDIVAAKAAGFEYDGPSYGTKPDLPDFLKSKYTFKSGTSMATPMVSGACALLIQAFRQKNLLLDASVWQIARRQPLEDDDDGGQGNGNATTNGGSNSRTRYRHMPDLIKRALMDNAEKLRREEEYEETPKASVVFGSGLVQINKSLERVIGAKVSSIATTTTTATPSTTSSSSSESLPERKQNVVVLTAASSSALPSTSISTTVAASSVSPDDHNGNNSYHDQDYIIHNHPHDLRQIQDMFQQLVDQQEITVKDANRLMLALQKISSDKVPSLLHMIDWHVASGVISSKQLQQMALSNDPSMDVIIPLVRACNSDHVVDVLSAVRTYLSSIGDACIIGNCYLPAHRVAPTGQILTTGASMSSKKPKKKQ
jgi:subtilisin family serine protease